MSLQRCNQATPLGLLVNLEHRAMEPRIAIRCYQLDLKPIRGNLAEPHVGGSDRPLDRRCYCYLVMEPRLGLRGLLRLP
jgi:hypothetical protein